MTEHHAESARGINSRDLAQIRRHWEDVASAGGDFRSGRTSTLVLALLDEIDRLRAALDEAQLRYIEASNPGIDMAEVRRVRAEHSDGRTCLCREVPAEPFPRFAWHEDCPQHGKKVNPYWEELAHFDSTLAYREPVECPHGLGDHTICARCKAEHSDGSQDG